MTDRPLVSIQRCTTYDLPAVRRAVEQALQPLGGLSSRIRPNDKVLLKPNLLFGQPPEKAVTTHPAVVETVAQLALDCGARVFLGDSPPLHSASRNARHCGMEEAVQRLGIQMLEFRSPTSGGWKPQRFTQGVNTPTLARELQEMDFIINLPKLKTHQQMLITCAVKNLFGCVIARRKAYWHFKLRASADSFAAMLLALSEKIAAGLTLVDAVISMEGMGPGHGAPILTGLILAGTDAVAVDRVVAEILGIDVRDHFVLRTAQTMGFPGANLQEIQLAGLSLPEARIPSFLMPALSPIGFSIPHLLRGIFKYLFQRTARRLPFPANE